MQQNLNHFENFKNRNNNVNSFLVSPPKYLNLNESIELYTYKKLNKDQRISFHDFMPSDPDLSLNNRRTSNAVGFQEPRGKSSSLFLATPEKVVGYVTIQIHGVVQFGHDIPKVDRDAVGLSNTDSLGVIKCLGVDKKYERNDCGTTLFALAVESIISVESPQINYIAWDALDSSKSFYTDKLGFKPFQLGKYNFVLKLS